MKKIFISMVISISCLVAIAIVMYALNMRYLRNLQSGGLPLAHDWNIRYCSSEDNCKSEVERVSIPASFTRGLLQNYKNFRGSVVLSKRIVMPESLRSEYFLLHLGKIGDADKTYFNNKLIGASGQFSPNEFSVWNKNRYYLVPSEIIKYNDVNEIKIVIGCYGFNRIAGNVFIKPISLQEYTILQIVEYAKNYFPIFCSIGIGFTFTIIFLMLCYNKSERRKYLYFLAQLIPGFFVVIEPIQPFPIYPDTIIRFKVFGIAWSVLVLLHLVFLHRLYQYRRFKTEAVLCAVTAILIGAILCARDSEAIEVIGKYVIILLTSLALYNVSLHKEQLIRKSDIAKLFFPIGLILALTAAHDGFVYLSVFTMKIYALFGYEISSPIFHYTSNAIFIGAGLIVVYQYIGMSREIENMNVHLEQKVEERTRELATSLENLSKAIELGTFNIKTRQRKYFSPQLEPKIKEAIIYIHNNFREDISREGLAAMLDIHHDYFSKAFKYYIGKSLNDYIYDLRIKEAIRLLLETEDNIIDIAMNVGFDSVKTFNRAFKKLTGKNPKDFRK